MLHFFIFRIMSEYSTNIKDLQKSVDLTVSSTCSGFLA